MPRFTGRTSANGRGETDADLVGESDRRGRGKAREVCDEGRLCAGLAHAYHHMNFAWNGRKKTMVEADSKFSLNENFPRPSESGFCFNRYWSKRCLKFLAGGKNHRP